MHRLISLFLVAGLGAAVLPACQPPAAVEEAGGIVVPAPGPDARIRAALDRVGSAAVSFDGAELATKWGTIATDRPDKLTGLAPEVKVLPIFGDAELEAAFLGGSDAAFAEALVKKGVKGVLLHNRITPSVDRGSQAAKRLYHHDHLEMFRLRRVSEGLHYYEVMEKPYFLPPALADGALRYVRARLTGAPPGQFPEVPPPLGVWAFAVVARGQGQELLVAFGQDKDLQRALEEVVRDLESGHRRKIELLGFPPLADHLASLTLELHHITERAVVEPRGEELLEDLWEMGIDGAFLLSADQKERAFLPGAVAYTRSIRTADGFLRTAAEVGGMSERRPWRDAKATLELVRSVHYREKPGGGVHLLYRGVQPVGLSQVSVEAVRQGVVAAGDWYMANLAPNGQLVYKFWPAENRYSNEYNEVRHTLATWNLVQAWEMDPSRTEFLEGSRRALDFTERFLKKETDPKTGLPMAYYHFNNNNKLGTVAVHLLGMIALARATNDHRWDEQMKEMGRFILFMQEDTGAFRGYHVPPGHPYYNQKNDIVPGEAALALVHLTEYFDDDAWIATLPKYWEYYMPWFRERAKKKDDNAPWPAYVYDNQTRLDLVQIGPWTVMAADAWYRRKKDAEAAAFGLEVARWMIETYEWREDRTPFPDYVGGYYKMPGELPAMQAFCYAEGTAAAYKLALSFKPDEAAFFEKATRETMRFSLQMQYDDRSTYAFSRPEQVDGGIRYAMNETKVRVDYVHHALSAMYQWVLAARLDPALPAPVKDGAALPSQVESAARRAAVRAGTASRSGPAVVLTRTGRYPVPMADVNKLSPGEKGDGQ